MDRTLALVAALLVAVLALAGALVAFVVTSGGAGTARAAVAPTTASDSERAASDGTALVRTQEPTPAPAAAAVAREPARTVVEPTEPPAPPLEESPYEGVRAARVAGRVLLPDGSPAAGVRLVLSTSLLGIVGEDESKWLRERLETDEDGSFESSELFPAGTVRARGRIERDRLDFARNVHEHLERRSRCDWTLRIAADLELRLRIAGAGEVRADAWHARIVHADEHGYERTWSWRGLYGAGHVGALRYRRSQIGEPPFVQPRVEVVSNDGMWRGFASLPTAAPRKPLDVDVEVTRVGAVLTGTVVTAEGEPIEDASVTCTPLEEERGQAFDPRVRPSQEGGFVIERCTPGRYRVEVTPDVDGVDALRERVVAVEAGTTELAPFVFDEVVGGIDGVVRCADGDVRRWSMKLRRVDGGSRSLLADRHLFRTRGEDPNGEGFAYGLLPRGVYELTLAPDWPGAFEEVTRTIVPPAHDLEIELDGCGALRSLWLYPVDRTTREPLDAFVVTVATDSLWCSQVQGHWSWPSVEAPTDDSFVWAVRAEGHRPTVGGPDELPIEDGVLEVPMVAGWGALVRVRRDPADRERGSSVRRTPPDPAVVGLALYADGVLVAETDATGTALVSLDARPDELTIPGWRVVSTLDVVEAAEQGEVLRIEPLANEAR